VGEVWRICREINVFLGSNIIKFCVLYPFVNYLQNLPPNIG
jgi:hypothetical protein